MTAELYQKVAYIGLRNPDGTYLMNIPLYVKVSEFNKHGMTDMQEELIHRVTEVMMKQYTNQIGEYMAKRKGEKLSEKIQGGV